MSSPPSSARRLNHPDHQPWGLPFALSAVALFKLAQPAQYSLLSFIFKITGSHATETFTTLYRLLWPLVTDAPVFAVVWLAVTRLYRRPLRTFGWSYPARLRVTLDRRRQSPLVLSALAGLLLAAVSALFPTFVQPGQPPLLNTNLESSIPFAVGMTLSAVIGAPLIEELIFRGVLYPAFLKRLADSPRGRALAVAGTSALFLSAHIDVYRTADGVPHPGHLADLAVASVAFTAMRAYSRRLLPGYVMHLVFNLCGAVALALTHLERI